MARRRATTRNRCVNGQNSASGAQTRTDRRIKRTRSLLRDALASLIRDKPYDAIVVKEILDRANVGKSTFYTHFEDKDDLLVSSIHGMVETPDAKARRGSPLWHDRVLWFSLPIFEYHYAHLHDGRLPVDHKAKAIHQERLAQVIIEMIEDAARVEFQSSADLIMQYIASTFVLVLNWWVDSHNAAAPQDVDSVFRSLVLPTLSAIRTSDKLIQS